MTRISGSGAEGNLNTTPLESTWAQPSGICHGLYKTRPCYFVADSESSAVRALFADDHTSELVVGGSQDDKDLMAFGDQQGSGYDAKLQHLMGVHYCAEIDTVFVADTYNHKIKTIRGNTITDFVGTLDERQRVVDNPC